ncbi:MAG: 16S rRNA (cytidine(1402)-2'-O)-methyltransferase [Clostridia bacterium]|nr:16S rRNA (cytidine(1402)-2'-O)-methyltransferase [Clostridia bacterium]
MNNGNTEAVRERNRTEDGALYLVATPIGNMADISERALKVLSEVSFVAAEDTRNSGLLLSRIGIKKPLVTYFEHNKASAGPEIVARLKNGESCALVTDAGTPAISDPGEDLVKLCAAEGIPVHPIPGCCAGISALSVSALSTSRFVFEGFLPVSGRERRERLEELSDRRMTSIIYEAPHRLIKTLADISSVCGGDRGISVCRELTKLNEEIIRGTVDEISAHFAETEPRGEFVLCLEGGSPAHGNPESMTVAEHVDSYIAKGFSEKEAIKAAARDRGVHKNEIYAEYKIKGKSS